MGTQVGTRRKKAGRLVTDTVTSQAVWERP